MKNPKVPKPYNKWITYTEWKKIPREERKQLTDLIRLQRSLRKYFKNTQPEEYVNWNAEIEYLKSIGEH